MKHWLVIGRREDNRKVQIVLLSPDSSIDLFEQWGEGELDEARESAQRESEQTGARLVDLTIPID